MTKQTDHPLSIEEAIKIVEKIIAFSIDDSVKEEERYTREHLFSLSLASLDWIYLTKVKNRKVKEDYAATSNIIKSVSEAYDCKTHTTQLEELEFVVDEHSTEIDKGRALVQKFVMEGHTKFAREVSNNIYILLSESENIIQDEVGRRIQEKYIKDKKENINKHYQEEFGK